MRRLIPLLVAGTLSGLVAAPAAAQNLCSPSTATASRAPTYPGSAPYSNSGTIITSNCTGPMVDSNIAPDPYAGQVYPVPGYVYGSVSGAPVLGGYSNMATANGAPPSSVSGPPMQAMAGQPGGATQPSALNPYAASGGAPASPYATTGGGQPSDPSTLYGSTGAAGAAGGYPTAGSPPAYTADPSMATYGVDPGQATLVPPGYPGLPPAAMSPYGVPGYPAMGMPYPPLGMGYPAGPAAYPGYPMPAYFGR